MRRSGRLVLLALACASGCYLSHERAAPDATVPGDGSRGPDASVPVDAGSPPDTRAPDVPPRPPDCPLAAMNAEIVGVTPLGDIHYQYAWAGRGNVTHACFDIALHASDEASVTASVLEDQLWTWVLLDGPPLGVHDVSFTHERGGRAVTSENGTVVFYRYPEPGTSDVVEAEIMIRGGGWTVDGRLTAEHCPAFRDPCL